MAISITQATEIGTHYQPDEIAAIAEAAQAYGLPLHMDGARFANAVVALELTPAEMTWKQGVDMLFWGNQKWLLVCRSPGLYESGMGQRFTVYP